MSEPVGIRSIVLQKFDEDEEEEREDEDEECQNKKSSPAVCTAKLRLAIEAPSLSRS